MHISDVGEFTIGKERIIDKILELRLCPGMPKRYAEKRNQGYFTNN